MNSLSENALITLSSRYLWRKKSGRLESPEEMFSRVAKHVSKGNKTLQRKFFEMMSDLDFLPNSPTLMNAGKKDGQLAACFVLPLEDDLAEIMTTLKNTALIHQSGGGTGFNFSKLRSHTSEVHSSHGKAAGPIGFLSLFNELTQTIKQGGLRRGANMGVLSVDHPDIEEFINIKSDLSRITNFNLSVSVTDKFMKAVKANLPWKTKLSARELFDKISQAAWISGEPGLIFIDEVNRHNPTPWLGRIEATNPCGEQPLLPYEACNLGSLNLNNFFQKDSGINFEKLAARIETAVIFLDQVIDTCHYPIAEIQELCAKNRKIGLGIMGFADLLLKMGIPYGSPESEDVGHKVMEFVRTQAIQTSQRLGKSKGSFEGFSKSFWKRKGLKHLRNATLTTIAPTGTISLLANASPGIEPVFSFAYQRNVLDGKQLLEIHPEFSARIKDLPNKEVILNHMSQMGTLQGLDVPDSLKKVFKTARDLDFKQHIQMQSVFQKHSDSAVSKTINFPSSATVEEVKSAFLMAHESKLKGITVYRDNSRPLQAMQLLDCPDCSRVL